MNDVWIVIGVCLVLVIGAAMPLIRNRGHGQSAPLAKPDTLRDWRNEERKP